MRLLILIVLIYLGYRALKSWLFPEATPKPVFDSDTTGTDDLMVKDPFCDVYFSKKDGVHLEVHGEHLYFCSDECKNNFITTHLNNV